MAVDTQIAKRYSNTGHFKIAEDFYFLATILKSEKIIAYCLTHTLVNYYFNSVGLSRARSKNLGILLKLYIKLEGRFFGPILFLGYLTIKTIKILGGKVKGKSY